MGNFEKGTRPFFVEQKMLVKMRVTINFQLKKSKAREDDKCPVYLRCTLDGERFELSTGIFILPDLWSRGRQESRGKTEEAMVVKSRLGKVATKVQDAFSFLESTEERFTVFDLKEKLLSPRKKAGLISVFDSVIKDIEARVGVDYSQGTLKHYKTSRKRIKGFISFQFKRQELPVSSVDYGFINAMDVYLKQKFRVKPNTAVTYHKHLKKVLNTAIGLNYIIANPYERFKVIRNESHRDYLTLQELGKIRDKEISTQRLGQVRDIFVFACYTGLGYAELKKLGREHIHQGDDGDEWIVIDRNKTDIRCRIPLLPQAKELLKKYERHLVCEITGKLLPVNSNQKMNEYLKELAVICGIDKNLTMHVSRHTFATSVTLTNGVPIETVSKMLGHTSIKTTQIYARIVDKKISEDMRKLKTIL